MGKREREREQEKKQKNVWKYIKKFSKRPTLKQLEKYISSGLKFNFVIDREGNEKK